MTHADLFARKNAKTGALTEEFFHGFDAGGDVFSRGNPYLNTSPAHMAFEAGRRAAFDFQRGDIVGAAASRGYSIRVKMKNGDDVIYAIDYDRRQIAPPVVKGFSAAKKNPISATGRRYPRTWIIEARDPADGFTHFLSAPSKDKKALEAKAKQLQAELHTMIVSVREYAPGKKRSPKKNPTAKKSPTAFVIRGTQATKSGYIYYYLHGDRFMSAIKGADVFSREKGEARMREIAPTLPAAIREITLVRKGRA